MGDEALRKTEMVDGDLIEGLSSLASEPASMRAAFVSELRSEMKAEVARRAVVASRPWWARWLMRPDAGPGPRVSIRLASAAMGLVLVLVMGLVFVRLYPMSLGAGQVATVQGASGSVEVVRGLRIVGDITVARDLEVQPGATRPLRAGDQVVTGLDGEAKIFFSDGSLLEVGPAASLVMQSLQARTESKPLAIAMRLERGSMRSQVEHLQADRDRFEVNTPDLIAQVRGTIFRVDVRSKSTRVATDQGVVRVNWDGKVVDVRAGREFEVIQEGGVPAAHDRPQSPRLTPRVPAEAIDIGEDGVTTIYTNAETVTWDIATAPGATVEINVDDELVGSIPADVNGTAALDLGALDEGVYTLTAVTHTLEGERSLPSPPVILVVDRTLPQLALYEPVEPQVTVDTIRVSGRTEPGVTLTLNGQPLPLDEEGFFQTMLTLSPGENSLTLVATDRAGNSVTGGSVVVYEKR